MLISEFSQATGLSKDTIRFYVRRGLIVPETGGKGGRNPYQIFTAEHVRDARIVRMAQSLGMSLKEIAALNREHRAGGISKARGIAIMKDQLARLEEKAAEIDAMASYLRAKLAWHKSGDKGPEPDFAVYANRLAKKRKAAK
ncbi:MAG TPA: MerR family transcriptional regulator [Rhizomicrobium sp.]|nr:MerR family transcriptional regulator [Rhizomicrobium sp.]